VADCRWDALRSSEIPVLGHDERVLIESPREERSELQSDEKYAARVYAGSPKLKEERNSYKKGPIFAFFQAG
jgi:hypothetical protein